MAIPFLLYIQKKLFAWSTRLIYLYMLLIAVIIVSDELHTLYRSSNTVKVINYRMLRWAGHVDRI